jgi:6-pyruvoyltetrahydropterin/6-carboxytetrahydropterin synthase
MDGKITPYRLGVGRDHHKFSAAHMTVLHDRTERLHGHNFQVRVTVELQSVAYGAFLDLFVVEHALGEICEAWNERLLLAADCPVFELVKRDAVEVEFRLSGKRYVVPAEDAVLLPVDNLMIELLAKEIARRMVAAIGEPLAKAGATVLEVEIAELPGVAGTFRLVI